MQVNINNTQAAKRGIKFILKIIAIFFILQFTFVGAILLFMSHAMTMNVDQIREKGGEEIVAVIRDVQHDDSMDSNAAYVEYYVGDKSYYNKLDFYSSDFEVGQEVTIIYERDNPDNIASINDIGSILKTIGTILVVASLVVIAIIVFGKIIMFLIMKKALGG